MALKEGQKTTIVLLIIFAILHLVGAVLTLVPGGVLTATLDAASNDLTELMFAPLRAVEFGLYAVGALNGIILVFECVLVKFANRLTTNIFIGTLAAVCVLIMAAGIAFNMVYTFWFYDLEVTWWQNMQTYFYDVNSSISTTQLSDKYALEWNQLFHYYQCCGIETPIDFQASSKWKRIILNGSQQVIPLWCCQMSGAASFPTGYPSDPYCYVLPSTSNSYIGNLCPTALLNSVGLTTWRVIVDLVASLNPALCIANMFMVLARLRYELCTERKTQEDEWIFGWGGDDSDDEEEGANGNEGARGGRRFSRRRWWQKRGKRVTDSAESDGSASTYDRWRTREPYLGPTVPDPAYVEPAEAQPYVPPAYEQEQSRF